MCTNKPRMQASQNDKTQHEQQHAHQPNTEIHEHVYTHTGKNYAQMYAQTHENELTAAMAWDGLYPAGTVILQCRNITCHSTRTRKRGCARKEVIREKITSIETKTENTSDKLWENMNTHDTTKEPAHDTCVTDKRKEVEKTINNAIRTHVHLVCEGKDEGKSKQTQTHTHEHTNKHTHKQIQVHTHVQE